MVSSVRRDQSEPAIGMHLGLHVTRGDTVTRDAPITAAAINNVVQRRASAAGLENASGYSAHSLRAGFVTEAKNRGIDEADIMRHTPAQERPDHAPLRPNLRSVDPQRHHRREPLMTARPRVPSPMSLPIRRRVTTGFDTSDAKSGESSQRP